MRHLRNIPKNIRTCFTSISDNHCINCCGVVAHATIAETLAFVFRLAAASLTVQVVIELQPEGMN